MGHSHMTMPADHRSEREQEWAEAVEAVERALSAIEGQRREGADVLAPGRQLAFSRRFTGLLPWTPIWH
jgi:hypothetical protein